MFCTQHVVRRTRDPNANLRGLLAELMRRAGIEPWEKLFQNMRATRETELAEKYPLQCVVSWIGNSQKVAMRSYLQVTEQHMRRAAGGHSGELTGAAPYTNGQYAGV